MKKVKKILSDDKSLHSKLITACTSGNLFQVTELIEQGVDIHAESEWTLCGAASNGHLSVVRYLVSLGADIHTGNDWALCRAAAYGHLHVAQYLVEQGLIFMRKMN